MQTPCAFQQNIIEGLPLNQIGIFGLMSRSHWIYIGAGDIRECLLSLFQKPTPSLTKHKPTLFLFEVTENYRQRERHLIREFEPICNSEESRH